MKHTRFDPESLFVKRLDDITEYFDGKWSWNEPWGTYMLLVGNNGQIFAKFVSNGCHSFISIIDFPKLIDMDFNKIFVYLRDTTEAIEANVKVIYLSLAIAMMEQL